VKIFSLKVEEKGFLEQEMSFCFSKIFKKRKNQCLKSRHRDLNKKDKAKTRQDKDETKTRLGLMRST